MPTLDLRDEEMRLQFGLITETVPGPSQPNSGAANGRSRAETEALVIALLIEHGPLTRNQLCRKLGRTKSPHMRRLFEQMVADGQVVVGSTIAENGLPAILYGVEL